MNILHFMKFRYILPLFFIFNITFSFSQTQNEWMHKDDVERLTLLGVRYKKPSKFNEIPGIECFHNIPRIHSTVRCLNNRLDSKDGEMVIFMPIHGLNVKKRFDLFKKNHPGMPLGNFDEGHIANIKYQIGFLEGKNWKKYTKYYTSRTSRSKFNADTVMRVQMPLNLKPEEYYQGNLQYLTVFIIQKNGVGHIPVYCFYSEKARKQMDIYWKEIESMLRFK